MTRLTDIEDALAHEDEPCCDHSGADYHGCWDCQNSGHAHESYYPRLAKKDLLSLVELVRELDELHVMEPYGSLLTPRWPGVPESVCKHCATPDGACVPWPCATAAKIMKWKWIL